MVVREQQSNFWPHDESFLIPENNSLGLSAGKFLTTVYFHGIMSERTAFPSASTSSQRTRPRPLLVADRPRPPNSAQLSGGSVNSSAGLTGRSHEYGRTRYQRFRRYCQFDLMPPHVNNRRLSPGVQSLLAEGDSVRFGECALLHRKSVPVQEGYVPGLAYSYVFHSFVERNPPGLSAHEVASREKLWELERTESDVEKERKRLEVRLQEIGEESDRM